MPDFFDTTANLSVLEHVPPGTDPIAYIRAAAPLPLHAEELIDRGVTEVALERLNVVRWMQSNGLTTPLPDWLGHVNIKWQKRTRGGGNPQFGMLPDITVRREDWKPSLEYDQLPVYIITEHFTIHPRLFAEWQLAVSRGQVDAPLDVTMVNDATRRMNEAVELATIEGPPIQVNGVTVPGLLDAPNTYEYTGNESWLLKDGPEIYTEVKKMMQKSRDKRHFGPWALVISSDVGDHLDDDYVTTMANTKTIRSRLMEIEGLEEIVTADMMPTDSAVLVEKSKTNLDLLVGLQPTVLSWLEGPPMIAIRRYIMIACVILRMREDAEGQGGIVVGRTGA